MALSFDLRLGVLAALFLFGAWASQAAAEENIRPVKPQRLIPPNNGVDPDVEPKTETPVVSSSPAPPTTTTPQAQSSTSIPDNVNQIKDGAEMADSIVHSGTMKTNGKAMFTHTMIFIAIIIALSHAKI